MMNRPILVIDDNHSLRELVTSILTEADFEVLPAPDGPTGIKTARAAHPAVILLDMMMPGLDGMATLAYLKQDPVLIDIPVIGITASPDSTYVDKALLAGAEFFLQKPFGAESLVQMVKVAGKAIQDDPLIRDRRRRPRFQATILVRCLIGQDGEKTRKVEGHTGNLSPDGLLLLLPEQLEPGTKLRLQLELPEGTILAEGAVIWQNPQLTGAGKVRHGIRLLRFAGAAEFAQYNHLLSAIAAGQWAHSTGSG